MRCLEQRCHDAYAELAVHCHVEASGFTWFDDRASWVEAADPAEQLAGHLYTHFYTSGQVIRRARRTEVTRDLQPQYDRIAGNERAWFDGWQVTARHPNRVGITDGSVHLSVAPDDVRPAAAADGPHQVRLPRLRRRMSPGFCAIPATAAVPAEDLMRVYISIDKSGAAALLATFLRHSPGLPDVQAKLLSSTASFERLDSFVAYLPPSRLIALTDLFSEIVHCHADHLRPNSPSLTGVLVPGIALAVEPSGGGSFGTTVCRILADALIAGDPSTLPAALRTAGLEDVPVPQALVAAARTWQRPRTPPSALPISLRIRHRSSRRSSAGTGHCRGAGVECPDGRRSGDLALEPPAPAGWNGNGAGHRWTRSLQRNGRNRHLLAGSSPGQRL